MWNRWRSGKLTGSSGRFCWTRRGRWLNRWLVARETNIVGASKVIGWEGANFAILAVTDLAVRTSTNWVRNHLGRSVRASRRRYGRLENFAQGRSIQANKFPVRPVTRAIGTERRVVFAARVVRIVTSLARGIVRAAVFVKPSRRFMRIRFGNRRERNRWHGTAGRRDFGNGVAYVAFESNRLGVV